MKRKPIRNYIRKLVYEIYENKCVDCFETDTRLLQIHHKDENPNNNDINNLELICIWCHALIRHPENAEKMIQWGIKKGIIK